MCSGKQRGPSQQDLSYRVCANYTRCGSQCVICRRLESLRDTNVQKRSAGRMNVQDFPRKVSVPLCIDLTAGPGYPMSYRALNYTRHICSLLCTSSALGNSSDPVVIHSMTTIYRLESNLCIRQILDFYTPFMPSITFGGRLIPMISTPRPAMLRIPLRSQNNGSRPNPNIINIQTLLTTTTGSRHAWLHTA